MKASKSELNSIISEDSYLLFVYAFQTKKAFTRSLHFWGYRNSQLRFSEQMKAKGEECKIT